MESKRLRRDSLLTARRLVQPVAVGPCDRGCILDRVFGCCEVAALAECLVAVEFDQDDRLAAGVAAFAEHRDARDEAELGRAFCDAVIRAADVFWPGQLDSFFLCRHCFENGHTPAGVSL